MMLDVTDRNIVVFGGGRASAEKLRTLSGLNKNITVISPEFGQEFRDKPWLNLIERKYKKGDLKNFDLVYSGINDPVVKKEILAEARENRIPINFIDDVEHSDFISAASLIRNSFTIFISTYGKGPGGTKKIRESIESAINLDALDAEVTDYIRIREETRNAKTIQN